MVNISVVVPVYNMERFLPKCMEALLTQTYQDMEIILVDDGSIDDSAAMCDKYGADEPRRIRVIHKANGGLSSARNAGMDAAKGKYVIFPDPDDWTEPDYLLRLSELIEHEKADMSCIGHYIDWDDHSVAAGEGESVRLMTGKEAQRALLLQPRMSGFAWNKLYCLEIIRKHKICFGDDVGVTEDLDFAYRYLKYCERVVFDPQARLYHYYQRAGAATHSGFSPKKLDSIHTYRKIAADTDMPELRIAAHEEICNTAINLTVQYCHAGCTDNRAWQKLRQDTKQFFGAYMRSRRYGMGRKIQAVLCLLVPRIYVKLKNRVNG